MPDSNIDLTTQPETILLVDDDELNIQVLKQNLASLNIPLISVDNGEDAIAITLDIKPVIILLDVMMPKMDGYETLQILQRKGALAYSNIIFMSALDSGQDKAKGLKIGAVDYIGKPFVVDEIIARIKIHLTLHRLKKSLEQKNKELVNTNAYLLKAVAEGVYGIDLEGKITFANPAACQFMGLSEQQLIGQYFHQNHLKETVDGQFYPYTESELYQTLKKGKSFNQVEAFFYGKKKSFPVLYSVNPLIENKQIYGAVIAFQDVSKQHKAFRDLAIALKNVSQNEEKLLAENAYLHKEQQNQFPKAEEIIGENGSLKEVIQIAQQVAPTTTSVLITGESGTGKEVIASLLHRSSPRKKQHLIKVNCGAISPNLIESELFGHEKGAFTGANKKRIGYFELADKGSIFLDEVGELPLDAQVKLLRVLQEQELTRVGGTLPIKINVRVIAATNQKLLDLISQGTFREDLYYRLNVFPIYLPPLRQRQEDIPLLAQYFLKQASEKLSKQFLGIEKDSLAYLQAYHWPGNIRELKNIIERATILSQGKWLEIKKEQINLSPQKSSVEEATVEEIISLSENERRYILKVLKQTKGVVSGKKGAARILDIPTSTLRSRMKKLGIQGQKQFE